MVKLKVADHIELLDREIKELKRNKRLLVRLCEDAIGLAGDSDHLSLRALTERKQSLKNRLFHLD